MSVTANDKGAVEQRVNLIKRGEGDIQHVMLNSILIKKSENYALMTDRFVTNMTLHNATPSNPHEVSPQKRRL